MTLMEDYIVNTVAGVSSAAIVGGAVWLVGGRAPRTDLAGRPIIVMGHGTTVVQAQPTRQVERVRERIIERRVDGPDASTDATYEAIGALAAAAVLVVLVYLTALPVLVPVALGASLAAGVVSISMYRHTPAGAGPRRAVLAFGVAQIAVVAATLWLRSHPLVGVGLSDLEMQLAEAVPGYGDGLAERGRALFTSVPEVLTTLGVKGVARVLIDVLAVECCTLLTAAQIRHLVCLRAFTRVGNEVDASDAMLDRADTFRRVRPWSLLGFWLVFSSMALVAASGYVVQWAGR